MASTSPQYVNTPPQIPPIEEETPHSTPVFRPAVAHSSPSFSSSSRSNSWDSSSESSPFFFNEEPPPYSTSIPLKFTGIPFSWEQAPGIPKNHHCFKKTESSSRHLLLPLPPAGTTSSPAKKLQNQQEISPKKHHNCSRSKMDPFFAALVECSKDDHGQHYDHGFKINSRSLSDRFGFINMYTSCKRTCAVSESIVYLPRASPHYLLHRRPRKSS